MYYLKDSKIREDSNKNASTLSKNLQPIQSITKTKSEKKFINPNPSMLDLNIKYFMTLC